MSKTERFYLPQLNGLRLVAFLMIFFVHAPVFFFTTSSSYLFEMNKLINNKLQISLNFGVDLFFCLSAFLITTILLLEFENKNTFSITNFLIRRVLRLWPLYFLYLLIVYLVLPISNVMPNDIFTLGSEEYTQTIKIWMIPSTFFFINNIGFSPQLTGHLWSISLEMQIYFTLPFVLYYFLTRPNKSHKDKIKSLVKVLMALFILSILIKYSYILINYPHPKIYMSTLSRLDPFIIGSFVAIKYTYFRHVKIPFQLPISLLLLSINFLLPSPFGQPNYFIPLVYLINAIGFGLILDYIVTYPYNFLSRVLSLKPLVYLGNLTYGLYIFHVLSLHLTNKLFDRLNLPIVDVYWILYILIAFLITFTFSFISYRFYEKKFLKMKLKFTTIKKSSKL